MNNCGVVKSFDGQSSNKGYLRFILLGNGVSIQVDRSTYSKTYIGDIISYYYDSNNVCRISRVFRKNINVHFNKKRYNVIVV